MSKEVKKSFQTGMSFGYLTITEAYTKICNKTQWQHKCICICGNIVEIRGVDLRSGNTQSCGCKRTEKATKHGKWNTCEYRVYADMKSRCYNTNNISYSNYGNRGITISNEWKDSFEQFYADMGPRPSADYQLDRVDNEKGYSKENCRWVTKKENNRNKRTNLFIEYQGTRKTLVDWCEVLCLDYRRVYHRLRLGWDVVRAFTYNKE